MGPLVYPKDRVIKSLNASAPQDHSKKRLWSGLNLLVVGPHGCGKMSLISALSRALNPSVHLTLFDFEAEQDTQDETLKHFASQSRRRREAGAESSAEGLIFRHLHRLSPDRLQLFLRICRLDNEGDNGSLDIPPPTLYATCFEAPGWDEASRRDFANLFPCQVHLAGMPVMRKDVGRFVLDVVSELNDRHGPRITEVESAVLDLVQRRAAWSTSLHELRSVLERAYFREDSGRLSLRSIDAA